MHCRVHECDNEMISNQWIPNVLDVTDALKVSLSGKKINGFVQRFEVMKLICLFAIFLTKYFCYLGFS